MYLLELQTPKEKESYGIEHPPDNCRGPSVTFFPISADGMAWLGVKRMSLKTYECSDTSFDQIVT